MQDYLEDISLSHSQHQPYMTNLPISAHLNPHLLSLQQSLQLPASGRFHANCNNCDNPQNAAHPNPEYHPRRQSMTIQFPFQPTDSMHKQFGLWTVEHQSVLDCEELSKVERDTEC